MKSLDSEREFLYLLFIHLLRVIKPKAQPYYSDAFPVYDTLCRGTPYELRPDKQETYVMEAVNADLRHYLRRLARKSRRVFLWVLANAQLSCGHQTKKA